MLTLVAGDHGEGLGDHGETTHGIFLFQEVMRVPLIVHGPEWGIRPAVVDAPVSLTDLAPTVLELRRCRRCRGRTACRWRHW